MIVKIQSIHFDVDAKLVDFIQKKLNKLDTYYDRTIDAEVILKVNNEGIANKTVEVKLNVPGEQLFANKASASFEAASDECAEALRRQIKRHKEKILAH